MSEASSLSRILAAGANKPRPDLAGLLELVTADAIANGRCQIIQFPRMARTPMTHKQTETAQVSLADIVLENIKDREAQALAQQLPRLPQPEPEETGNEPPKAA